MKYQPFLPENVSPLRAQHIAHLRQTFKQQRMRQTGVGVFWTPDLAAKEGALQVNAAAWQSPRQYADRAHLINESRLNNARDNYAIKPLAISMRGAETWKLKKGLQTYIFKQDPRVDSYVYEKAALQRITAAYGGELERHRFPLLLDNDDKQQILITPYLPGKTLADIDPMRVNPEQKITYLRGILQCLDLLHRLGIAHFDLAPRKFKLTPRCMALIDYGSCGLGQNIELVRIGHLRNRQNPEGPRFHRAPELAHCLHVNGRLAERYGIARLAYWLHFGTVAPLIAAASETGYIIDPAVLVSETQKLSQYNARRDEPLLRDIAINFSPQPNRRVISEDELFDSFCQSNGRPPLPRRQPILEVPAYAALLDSFKPGDKVALCDFDNTLFTTNTHDFALLQGGLAQDRKAALAAYRQRQQTYIPWKIVRRCLYISELDDQKLYRIGKDTGKHLLLNGAVIAAAWQFLAQQTTSGVKTVILTGSPTPLVQGIIAYLWHELALEGEQPLVFGTEYHYTGALVSARIENYAQIKRLLAEAIVQRGATLTSGFGDSLHNDRFLEVVAASQGAVYLISPKEKHERWNMA